jgi:acyl-CoA reductase-like NAD-dependent aldehyde dehydrogenase
MSPDYRLYIDGAFRDAVAGGTIGVIDPALGCEFARVAYGSREDARLAIAAAARAFPAWRGTNVYERAAFLHRAAGLMRQRVDQLTESLKLADRLEAGGVAINEFAPATAQAPFGGMKQSGIGREGGWQVLDAYTETKMVSIVL